MEYISLSPLPKDRRFLSQLLLRDGAIYTIWAAVTTLLCARSFYGYMLKQTGGEWSAPLDDVFIHFDYARSTALGHPFEWTIGNGYSSGNTSILYPFVLAAGYLVGFVGQRIMVWAAVVAATSVFGVLLVARRLLVFPDRAADAWARASSYLLPPMLLGIGALDWSLWSGMEVAFFLAMWAGAMKAYLDLLRTAPERRASEAWKLGIWGAAIVLTRPEGATTIAVLGLAAAIALRGNLPEGAPRMHAIGLLARVGAPSTAAVTLQSLANRVFTGEWTANGAIVKLAVYSPFLTPDEKLADYIFNLKYEILRNTEYHFTDRAAFGFLLPALALAALAVRRTRHIALVLWGQIAGWLLLVALNGQVRWQNERYTMPAVAWLLLAAGLGASALMRRSGKPGFLTITLLGALAVEAVGVALRPANTNPELRVPWLLAIAGGAVTALAVTVWPVRLAWVVASLWLAHDHQAANYRGQRWFFGRACRNIRDQHIVAGRALARMEPPPHRVLVGDAGALIYASDLPGLDIIGLGGYGKLPFARAGVQGLPATLELMEHMPRTELPDVLAIYPTWWGVLPTWFSKGVKARFPVEGNVICGGYEDVVYEADWHLLGTGALIRDLAQGEAVRDAVDVADLVSEGDHDYRFPSPAGGWTEMKILPDTRDPLQDMWDGGRRIGAGREERFVLRGLDPGRAAHLVVRSAPSAHAAVRVLVDKVEVDTIVLEPKEGWVERAAAIPSQVVKGQIEIELFDDGPGEFVDYHAWVTQ